MKLLHLSDLHIGKKVNGFSMINDQIYILKRILEYVSEYAPQAVILAGDIYDKRSPGVDAVKVFDNFLYQLAQHDTTILAISGNHDSPERLGFASGILSTRNIFLSGVFNGTAEKVRLEDQFGPVNFYLLPFIRPSLVKQYFDDDTIENYDDALRTVLQNIPIDTKERNVLVSHQFVVSQGENSLLCESEIGPIGGIDQVSASYMSHFDYVALGHLHGPQKVFKDYIRYAGSPLKYSFSECNHKKSVCLIDLKEKGQREISFLPLNPLYDMRKIKGPFNELLKPEIVSAGNNLDYIHVSLTNDTPITDPLGKLRLAYPNIMVLSFDNLRSHSVYEPINTNDPSDMDSLGLFKSFYKTQNGALPNTAQLRIMEKILEEDRL